MKKLFLLLIAVLSLSFCAYAQEMTVTGVVMSDTDDEPIVGASVIPVGTKTGTTTNIDGEFTLKVPANVKEIQISYVGMKTVTVPVAAKMTIRLKTDNALDEVVVTGYQPRKVGNIVGPVSVVDGNKIANTPTTNFVDALQGQVPGLSILSASGDPSSLENDIRIRGVNSLNSSTTPLFILDGSPVSQAVFNTLNPSDIENITVLKDAASTAIYGTRAANGVIVITSKKGKFGNNASVTIRANVGWSQMTPDKVDMMNSHQYRDFRNLIDAPLNDEANYAIDVLGINTDWRAETFDGHAPTYSLDASVTGGSENLSYYIGLSHYDQQGIIDQSGLRRDVLRANINAKINNWFRMGLQTNLGYARFETNNESNAVYSGSGVYITNPMVFSRKAMPFDSPYYYTIGEDGKAIYGDRALFLHFSQIVTPKWAQEGRSVWQNRLTINASIYEQITPIKGLVLKAQQAVDAYDSRLKNYNYPKGILTTPMGDVFREGINGDATIREGINQQSFSRYYSFTYTNTASYNHTFGGKHNMSLLAGEESIITRSEGFSAYAKGYRLREMMLLGQGSEPLQAGDVNQSLGEYSMNSIFFNGSYNFMERYFFDASYRRDGSSRFPKKHRWGDFWSVGAMWTIQKENFMKNVKWVNDLRVRFSYGTSGNSGIGNYAYQGLMGTSSITYNGGTILGISQIPTEDLTWETVYALDFGIAGRLFNRLSFDIDFYNKDTKDMLMGIPWSVTTGFGSGIGNIGSMRNTGVDIDLNADIFSNKDWYVGARVNLNYNHNEITELFQGRDSYTLNNTGTRYEVGHGAGEYYVVRYAGVDPRDGRQMWYTREGNLTKVYNEERDAVMVNKSQFAPLSGGFGVNARWKGLSISADFTWAAKKYMINNDRYFIENSNFGTDFNQMTSMLDIWTTPGQITDIPKVGETIQFDSHLLENASFMRLKNLSVRYALPDNLVRKARLQQVAVHFTGRNLWTLTNYTGYDPEPESNVVTFFYPNTRQYEFGIEVSF